MLAGTAGATSINIPNGSFETDAAATTFTAGGAHPTSWNTQFAFVSQVSGPNYGIQSLVQQPLQGPDDGTKYLSFWPGEIAGSNATAPTVQTAMTASVTVTSTGITDTTIAGQTYIATVAVGEAAFGNTAPPSPAFTVSILDKGNVVASNSFASGALTAGTWNDLSSLAYIPSASGDSLQVQVTASKFYEGPGWFKATQAMFDNARLTTTAVPEPASGVLLALGLVGLLGTFRRLRRA